MDKKKMKRIPDEKMFEVTGGIYKRPAAVNSAAAAQPLGAPAGPNLAEKLPAVAGIPSPADKLPAAAGTPVQADTLDVVSETEPTGEKSFSFI